MAYLNKKHSEEYKKRMSETRMGKDNPNWKGDLIKYAGVHAWVKSKRPHKGICEDCGKICIPDLANISQKYLRNTSDWEYLCRYCHMNKDGRLDKLKQYNEIKKLKEITCSWCGITFAPWNSRTMFCSQSCGTKNTNKRRWDKVRAERERRELSTVPSRATP